MIKLFCGEIVQYCWCDGREFSDQTTVYIYLLDLYLPNTPPHLPFVPYQVVVYSWDLQKYSNRASWSLIWSVPNHQSRTLDQYWV